MPYPTEHAARIDDPKKYDKIRRDPDPNKFGKGVAVIWGVLKDGTTEVQALRFDSSKFTVAEAKEWLKDHDYTPIEFEPATEKSMSFDTMQFKSFDFAIHETKEIKANNGQNYGCIKGYVSTFGNVDAGGDVVEKGAFVKCLNNAAIRGKKIPILLEHDTKTLIGGVVPAKIYEDAKGLYFEGEVNLDVVKGKEAYSLAKQGVLNSMSFGYFVKDYDISMSDDGKSKVCRLKELDMYEVSMTAFPMNVEASIDSVKNTLNKPTMSLRELLDTPKSTIEKMLRETKLFSRKAVTHLVTGIDSERNAISDLEENEDVINEENTLKNESTIKEEEIITETSSIEVNEQLKTIVTMFEQREAVNQVTNLTNQLNTLAKLMQREVV